MIQRDSPYQNALRQGRRPFPATPKPVPNVFEEAEEAREREEAEEALRNPGSFSRLEQPFPAPAYGGRLGPGGVWAAPATPADGQGLLRGGSRAGGTVRPPLDAPANPGGGALSFPGMTFGSVGGWFPPDTQGAVGPAHVMIFVNGGVAIYQKSTGATLAQVSLTAFFTAAGGYPRNGAFDPRVVYDRQSGRWFAVALEFGATRQVDNDAVLAVSRTPDPTGPWDKYVIPLGVTPASGTNTYFTDYPTLGVDAKGVYIAARIFGSPGGVRIMVTPKAPLVGASPGMGALYEWGNTSGFLTDFFSVPHAATNLDDSPAANRAWFLGTSPTGSGLRYRTVTWSGDVPQLSTAASAATTIVASVPPRAPANGSSTNIDAGDFRLMMAVIRKNELWAARTVGVNSAGGSSTADRSACEWICLNVSAAIPSLVQSGRIYDPTSNPRSYYFPSLTVNGQGNVVAGFSGSSATEYVGAFACGRLATDPLGTMRPVYQIRGGDNSYTITDSSGRNRWGDYSYTAVDPDNDQTVWTFQEYASGLNSWGTWSQQVLAPAPTVTAPVSGTYLASGTPGQRGVVLRVTGTNFFDPGAGFASRPKASIAGGTVNGVSNVRTFFLSPTSLVVQCDVGFDATPGPRSLTVTNPDGQSVTLANALNVTGVANTAATLDVSVAGVTGTATTYDVNLGIRNLGLRDATGVQVTSASLTVGSNTAAPSAALPMPAGGRTVVAGGRDLILIPFARQVGQSGQRYTVRYQGRSAAGTFSGVFSGTLP